MNPVFITGGTGYIGRPLIGALLEREYAVTALVRSASAHKLPRGAGAVIGDALDAATFANAIPPNATFGHLIGTPHPNPAKAAEFQRVDLASITAAVLAARQAGVRHFVYVSVAHPAPVMRAYIAVREQGESLIQASGIAATILRPWYGLGSRPSVAVCLATRLRDTALAAGHTSGSGAIGTSDSFDDDCGARTGNRGTAGWRSEDPRSSGHEGDSGIYELTNLRIVEMQSFDVLQSVNP